MSLPGGSSANFPKTQAQRAGSASHSSANKKRRSATITGHFFALSARGDFGGEPRGSTPKSVFPMLARPFGSLVHSARARNLCNLSLRRCLLPCDILFYCGMAAFTSTILFLPPSLPMRRNSSPRLSTSYATAQFTRVLFRLCV